ncbi:hypothetical protein, partial [Gemmiger formicilis]|uniref:hypothetical protein n=1 Tax=Gemmiger formicilis TaxID=745368 RepID=UPI00242CAD6A
MKNRHPEILQKCKTSERRDQRKAFAHAGFIRYNESREFTGKRCVSHGGSLSARQYPAADAGA